MDFTNSTFAHGLQIGQTLAPHASNGQAIPGNCSDKTSSEKMKNWKNVAKLLAMLLFFANMAQVHAQIVTVNQATGINTDNYVTKWSSAGTNPATIINSLIYENGAVGINTNSPLTNSMLDVENAASLNNTLWGINLSTSNTSTGLAANVTSLNVVAQTATNTAVTFATLSSALNSTSGSNTVGVEGYASGGGSSSTYYGVQGIVSSGSGSSNTIYAGYFDPGGSGGSGNTYWALWANGDTYCPTGLWTASDQKLKDNILPLTGALDNIMKMQPKTYTYRTAQYPTMHLPTGNQMGLIVQDIQKLYPDMVKQARQPEERDTKGNIINPAVDFMTMNYTELIPVVISGIQEQQGQIATLQAQNAQLQSAVSDLQEKYNTLVSEVENLKNIQAQYSGNSGSNINNDNGNQPSLAQNVPNPFTQNTVISYYLPANMPNAVITVRSMTGATLQSFNITSAGHGQVTVSQGTLAPATYEYDMIVNGKLIDSKKMVIIGQ